MLDFSQYVMLADLEGFFGIVFFLIAFVGWVINLVNQNQEQNKPPRRRPPNQPGQRPNQPGHRRKKDVQSEIDQFLGQSRRNSGKQSAIDTDDVEVIAPPPGRRPAPRRRRTREEVWEEQAGVTPPQKPKPARPKPATAKSKGRGLAARHLESQERRTSEPAKKPKRSQTGSRLTQQVERDLPHAVDASVAAHLKPFTADSPTSTGQIGITATTSNRKSKGSILGNLLQYKAGIRNAIILNEILSPPKSMRK